MLELYGQAFSGLPGAAFQMACYQWMALLQNTEVLHHDSLVRDLRLHTASLLTMDSSSTIGSMQIQAACISAWTYWALACSGTHSNWQPSMLPNKCVAAIFSSVAYAALEKPKRPKYSASSLLIGIARWTKLKSSVGSLKNHSSSCYSLKPSKYLSCLLFSFVSHMVSKWVWL